MKITGTTTADAVESRLASLETALAEERRRRRRIERLGVAGILAGVGLATIAATQIPQVADVVQTRRLEVLDDAGRVVLLATTARHGGRIDVWDNAQANVARLGANGAGGDLSLFDRDGRRSLSAFSDGRAGRIEIGGTGREVAVEIGADEGGGRVAALGDDGRPIARIQARRGKGVVAVGDAGIDLVEMTVDESQGRLTVRPEDGDGGVRVDGRGTIDVEDGPRRRVRIASTTEGGRIELGDHDGRSRLSLGVTDTGGLLDALDERGTSLVSVGIGAGGSGMRVRNAEGVGVAAVGVDSEGRGAVEIAGDEGTRVAGLGVGLTGGRLTLSGLDGRSFLEAGGDGDGGRLEIRDAEERPVVAMAGVGNGGRIAVGLESARVGITLEVAGAGIPTVSLIGPGGRTVAIAATPSGGLINLFDANGQMAVATGAATDDPGGVLSIRNDAGIEIIRAGSTSDQNGLVAVSDSAGRRVRRLSP